MPDLNDFINKSVSEKTEDLEINEDLPLIGGSFMCQECDKEVGEAFFKHKEEKLTWTCPNGHVSSVPFK